MKILLITYTFYPDLTPRAFRWGAIVAQMAQWGHEVHVLCAAPSDGAEEAPGVTVHRVPDSLLARLKLREGASAAGAARSGGPVGWRAATRARMRSWIRPLWQRLYWPDYAIGWVLPGLRKASVLYAEYRYDWVVSSSHPFTGHLVAWRLTKRFPEVKWLVDISDPYSQMSNPAPYNRKLYQGLSRWVEAVVLRRAQVVSVTTESTAHHYAEAFPGIAGKVQVIPPLLSLPHAPARSFRSSETLRLVYVGTLYRTIRNPGGVLRCLDELALRHPDIQFELHFYGAVNDCVPELAVLPQRLKEVVYVHGLVSRARVLQAMVDADVLVNIGNASQTQLASKVIEYMAMGRPIWNVVSIEDDTSVQALKNYPAAYHLHVSESEAMGSSIDGLACFLRQLPSVSEVHARTLCAPFLQENITQKYLDAMK